MDIKDDGAFLTAQINGKDLRFGKLSPNDRRAMLKSLRETRRKAFIQTMKDGGITGPAFVNEVDAFDQAFWGEREFFGFADSYDGQAEIITTGLKKGAAAGVVPETDFGPITLDESRELVAKIAGIKIMAPDMKFIARQQFKIDLRDAGISGDAVMDKLAEYDTKHEIAGVEDAEDRPSVAG